MASSATRSFEWDVDRLRRHSLFRDIDDAVIELVARHGEILMLPAECTIFEQGEHGDSMMVLLEGQLSMSIEASDGRNLVVRWLHGPDMFGEACGVSPGPRPLTATTQTPCEVVEISHAVLLRIILAVPAIHRAIVRNIADDVRFAMQLVGHTAFKTSRQRVAEVLISLAGLNTVEAGAWHVHGRTHEIDNGWVILPEVSIDELARMAATSRETASRTVSHLERNGVLKRGGDKRLAISPSAIEEVGLPSDGRRARRARG